jgi:3-dehydroquinate dehydratase-2
MTMTILVIHGPNLNLLGQREPDVYGKRTLKEIDVLIVAHGKQFGIEVRSMQSNHEGAIIDAIQGAAASGVAAIVLNPGAYAHTSMAIADAIRSVTTPVVEVHLTNLYARGGDRATSITAAAAKGIVSGFGYESYLLGIDAAIRVAATTKRPQRRAVASRARRVTRRRR